LDQGYFGLNSLGLQVGSSASLSIGSGVNFAYGPITLHGNQTLTVTPLAGQSDTIGDAINDDAGSGTGVGRLVMNGAGTLYLTNSNSFASDPSSITSNFTGGIAIQSGVLDIGVNGAAGAGDVTIAGGRLVLDTTSGQFEALQNTPQPRIALASIG